MRDPAENARSRIAGPRKLLSLSAVLALIVRIAPFTTRRIPARQPPSSPRLIARPGPPARR